MIVSNGKDTVSVIKLLEEIPNFFQSKVLFILGAGVSSGYIKPEYNLRESAKKIILKELFSFPVFSEKLTDVSLSSEEIARYNIGEHILHETDNGKFLIDETNIDFFEEIIIRYPQILEFTCALSYSLDEYPNYCPEYQIFNLANSESLIVNLNHDNLAEYFIRNKNIVSLHGTITPELKNSIKEIVPHILDMDLRGVLSRKLYLPTRENERLLAHKKEYFLLQEQLNEGKFQYIVIIGYSFFQKNDSEIHDIFTYDIIRSSFIKHRDRYKIVIINFNQDYPYKARFPLDILDKNTYLLACQFFYADWSKFTCALFRTNEKKDQPYRNWEFNSTDLKRFIYFYYNCNRITHTQNIHLNCADPILSPTFLGLNLKSFSWQ